MFYQKWSTQKKSVKKKRRHVLPKVVHSEKIREKKTNRIKTLP